jgi:hypothetical protein
MSCEVVGSYQLRLGFDDSTEQTIDFKPILKGKIFGPLSDISLFNQVKIDPEVHTIVWPNGADFDPATLRDWPANESAWRERAARWESLQV